MHMDNKFGKISRISACAALKDGKTILEELSFTAPYKIMMPFERENGGIQIMPLCASAGIMAGDSQNFFYHVKEGADLEVLSQSFEKIHKMDEGAASRTIEVQVDKNATLYYYPQPVIPFAQSSFDSRMPMEGIGMYEGYTHVANIFLTKLRDTAANLQLQEKIWQILDEASETEGGITRLTTGDMALRIFGQCAQKLQQTAEKIKKLYEHEQKQNMGAADYGSDSGI